MPTGRARRPRVPFPAKPSSASPHSQMPGNPASRVVLSTAPGDAVPAWVWDTNAAAWEEGFEHLRGFVERDGHARVPGKYEDEGFQLGTWVRTQRTGHKKGRLTVDKITRLEAIPGWVWNINSVGWEEGFEHLRRFVEREGHARVPRKYEDDGYRLGEWVDRQRTAYSKGQLKADRVMRLEALRGWGWNPRAGLWEEGFEHLRRFVEREGHGRVPRRYRYEGYQVGSWVNTQRTFYARGHLTADRVTRLEALPGWVWNAKAAAWEEWFEHMRRFVEREGHARVPYRYEDGDFRLGQWVSNMRARRGRGQLVADRVTRLEGLPGWAWSIDTKSTAKVNIRRGV